MLLVCISFSYIDTRKNLYKSEIENVLKFLKTTAKECQSNKPNGYSKQIVNRLTMANVGHMEIKQRMQQEQRTTTNAVYTQTTKQVH